MDEPRNDPQSILWSLAEKAKSPDEIDLWPIVESRLRAGKTASRQQEKTMNTHILKPLTIRIAVVTLLLIAAGVLFTLTPPGQAFASQVIQFFRPAQQMSYPATPPELTGQLPPEFTPTPVAAMACPQSDIAEKYACDLEYAEDQVGFLIKALPLHPDLPYSGMDLDLERGIVHLYYGPNATIWIAQGEGDYPQSIGSGEGHWNEVPANYVQAVTVNGQPGEYVEGGFVQLRGSDSFTWLPEVSMARLRWKDGDHWYQMTRPGTPETLSDLLGSREALIRLAESLVGSN